MSEDPVSSDDGVDVSLIRWMLSLTMEERFQLLESHAAFVQDLRDANPTLRLPVDAGDPGESRG